MLKNYIKIALRNMFRNSLVSFINLFGLALSMSICLLVLMRFKDRLDYDRFHPQPDNIYRVITQLTNKEGNTFRFATSPLPLANTLSTDYNVAKDIVHLYAPGAQMANVIKKRLRVRSAFTEPSFFNVFGFTLKQGDPHTALQEPNSIVLSASTAVKLFGKEDVVGQTIQLEQWGDFRVTGILNEPAGKSHIEFDAYTSMSSLPLLEKTGKLPAMMDQWNGVAASYTYVRVNNGVTKRELTRTLNNLSASLMKMSKTEGKERISFEAQPFNKIILGEELLNGLGDTGSRGKVWAEVIISFVILLMACFNYTNLSIARSLKRGKEIGVRKVAGALRWQVFSQLVVESVLMSLFALGFAYVLLRLLIDHAPFAPEMVPAGATITISLFAWFLLFSLFTGLLAGILPSWVLSSFKPVDILKNLTNIRLFGGNIFRKSLTVLQFSLSLFIIIFTIIFSRQFHYIATADPGFRRDNMLYISLNGTGQDILHDEIARLNGVEKISASSALPGRFGASHCLVKAGPGNQQIQFDYADIDSSFITNTGLKLIAGNTFPSPITGNREQYVMVNEKALKALNVKEPIDAIGKPLWLDDSIQVQIAGVVKDFYARGLDMPVTPLVFRNRPAEFNYLNVHTFVYPGKTLITDIERIWKANYPGQPFEYSWLKDELYEQKSAWGTVSMLGFLAIIAITISCLGLLGMVIYTTESRRKEIGIRKVMGAGVHTIMLLLSKSFLKLILIAAAIALPLSYIAGWLFLNIFANRITISVGMLASGLIGLLLIVLLTIGIRIYKVAASNPVNSLRTD